MNQDQIHGKFGAVADILTTLELLGIKSESFNTILEELPVNIWIHDDSNTIVYVNSSFRENFGDFRNKTCHQCMMGKESVCSCCLSRKTLENENTGQCKLCKRSNSGFDLNLFHTPIRRRDGRVVYILKTSCYVGNLTILAENYFSGLGNKGSKKKYVVMCASCKRIKDQDNKWIAVDNTIINCFKVRISHGICRECAAILYPMLNIRGLP